MLRAAAILIGALALLGLSGVSGMDRMARTDPAIAAQVPLPFASAALRTLGNQALAAQRGGDAAAYGWHALDRAPLEADAVALFAAGQLASGKTAQANRAFAVAGRMGWRVPVTQAYWFSQALQTGDYPAAAMRLDALLRQQPTMIGQQALLDPVERDPAARAALIERLDPETAWLGKYLNEVFALPPQVLRQRALLMVEAADAGLVLGCERMSNLAGAMTNLNLFSEASALWDAQCPQSAGLLKGGDGLATLNLQGTRNPFAWQAVGNGDLLLGVATAAGGKGRRLTIDGTPQIAEQFLTKLLLLEPGRYRLTWRAGDSAEDQTGNQSQAIRAALVCKGEEGNRLEDQTLGTYGLASAVVTIPPNCAAQLLSFARAPGGSGSVWLEDVRLDQLP
ncbi:MAG: hypothetical protein WBL74_06950 [Novosphingobium sp.]|uniref:hypothetical protein n=1 Tax=Novosphingobium sp. TaxID=1874826 RepID=UPI003C7DA83E